MSALRFLSKWSSPERDNITDKTIYYNSTFKVPNNARAWLIKYFCHIWYVKM